MQTNLSLRFRWKFNHTTTNGSNVGEFVLNFCVRSWKPTTGTMILVAAAAALRHVGIIG